MALRLLYDQCLAPCHLPKKTPRRYGAGEVVETALAHAVKEMEARCARSEPLAREPWRAAEVGSPLGGGTRKAACTVPASILRSWCHPVAITHHSEWCLLADTSHTPPHIRPTTASTMTTAFDTLRASLRRVLAEARFDLGRVTSEHRDGWTTTYAKRQGEVVGPERLREMLAGNTSGGLDAQQARSARVYMAHGLESDLTASLRRALGRHCDPGSDCVGHAFPMGGDRGRYSKAWPSGVYTHAGVTSMERFSATMAQWAAFLGVDAVIDLLAAWTQGEPLTYRTCVVVGLTLDQPLRPAKGIRITPLPLSTADLPSGLPTRNDVRRSAYLGHAVLSVKTLARPALFRPGSKHRTVRAELPRHLSIDLICQALSLECDQCVDSGLGWNDYGDLSALTSDDSWGTLQRVGEPVGQRSSTTGFSNGVTTIELHPSSVQNPSEDALRVLVKTLKGADARTRVAVARWKQSMRRHTNLTDGFIDLRIALESLFLPQTPDYQLKFRLATNGAWLVGLDGADRREAWKVLGDAYDAASKAVHHGKVKQNDNTKKLLARAQLVCRRGILRVLRDGPVSDWNGLILDALSETPA